MRRPGHRPRSRIPGLLAVLLAAALAAGALAVAVTRSGRIAAGRPDAGRTVARTVPSMAAGRLDADRVELAAGAFSAESTLGFALVFEPPPPAAGGREASPRALLLLEGDGTSARYELDIPEGGGRIAIPCPGLPGFLPRAFSLSWLDGRGGRPPLGALEALEVPAGAPIPADLGAVLVYRTEHWRRADFEVFRWSARDSILVFDTASYDVQDRLFKRLAFFVEKKGWTGTIPDMESIAGLHGFNAHDYRAEDLARFYAAAAGGVELLPEEIALRELLLASGVLVGSAASPRAGAGGVLSISRSSAPAARRRFLTHEAIHGLYFTSAAFRAGATAVWEGSSDGLRQFVRLYLSWPDWSYDLDNPYLLVNEFAAYLLQYREEEVGKGLFGHGIDWLRERFPDRGAWLGDFAKGGLEELLGAWRGLEAVLAAEIGARGGDLSRLRPAG